MRGRSPSFSSTVGPFTSSALFFVRLLREPLIPQLVVRCPEKRSLNEPRRKRCQMRQKARLGVSYSHLNKHRLINSLEGWINETGLWHRNTRTGLPPKISPKLPGSELGALRAVMDQVYALFDRRCRTQTALAKLAKLRRRLQRFRQLGETLKKL